MSLRKLPLAILLAVLVTLPLSAQKITCPAAGSPSSGPITVTAEIAAIDQPYMLNRYGAAMPQGMIFALKSDVIPIPGNSGLNPGKVMLRPTKRPRPIVLRVRQGDCLQITLWNYLGQTTIEPLAPMTNYVGFHVNGLELVNTIADDASLVGKNAGGTTSTSGLIPPSATNKITYTLYAPQIGPYLAYSAAAMFGGTSNGGGQLTSGLFGTVTVEPPGAEMYRSQITAADLSLVTSPPLQAGGPPILKNYTARYAPNDPTHPPCSPILQMVAQPATVSGTQCVVNTSGPWTTYYTDLTALITGPNQGNFINTGQPEFNPVPASPNRTQPFREFTIHYHEALSAVQAFPEYYYSDPVNANGLSNTLGPGSDQFAINYGTGGIGTEILANRLNLGFNAGPSGSQDASCVECKFEEFFLSAWAVGDPAMVVDKPANAPVGQVDVPNVQSATTTALTNCALAANEAEQAARCTSPAIPTPQPGRKATLAFFPDDPSNVYHSYLNDHVVFRILHAGAEFTHVHHQHAHQWLHSPNSPNGSYLDSQLISPGAAFTLEMVYNGSGNRNKTAGDSIFHCHFYPHFAAGMWSMWRVHDVFEGGTQLDNNGRPVTGARALPDGEIANGTPIPAIVPIPTLPMAPVPAKTVINPVCSVTTTPCPAPNILGYAASTVPNPDNTLSNPGYPFFVPGVAGHRPPRPPMDVACENPADLTTCYDGGLQRHIILAGSVENEQHNQWDFSKDNVINVGGTPTGTIVAQQLAEMGEPVERAAMSYMGIRNHASYSPKGVGGSFVTNGLPRGPQQGAPYADPAVDDNGAPIGTRRLYKAANVQMDVAFNKKGWHYPQERFLSLWGDVQANVNGTRAPEPFFFRANSATDYIEYWHMNLVPSYYELDDFQVRTPTDILGQHIHLVKFDVLASDGAANGFNYEDGTLSPDEVRDRINGIRNQNACTPTDPRNGTFQCPVAKAPPISVTPPPGQDWTGAMVTVQRWYADELTGCVDGRMPNCNQNGDRTLRTVFTHDHFGPSTHQQIGLYAGLLVEPTGSTWTDPITGTVLGSNPPGRYNDGGPTSWQAIISKTAGQPGYREFALEFQDLAHAYWKTSRFTPTPYTVYNNGNPINIMKNGKSSTTPPVWGWVDCANQVNAPGGGPGSPCDPTLDNVQPLLIDSRQNTGTFLTNYRNEPAPMRTTPWTPPATGVNAFASDLAHVYESITRSDPDMNVQPSGCFDGTTPPCTASFQFPGAFPGAQPTDPYTPLLQAYQGDNVQVRVLVGAHFFNHNFGMPGLKWLFEPSNGNSGWRDNQAMGISEHFEFLFNVPSTPAGSTLAGQTLPFTDYLWTSGSGVNDIGEGLWGLLRAYSTGGNASKLMPALLPEPTNPTGGTTFSASNVCPTSASRRSYNVAAITPSAITYNNRDSANLVTNPNPIVYVPSDSYGNPLTTTPSAPLVLRANANECVTVTLYNQVNASNSVFTTPDPVLAGGRQPFSQYSADAPTTINLYPSTNVGMHAQLVSSNASTQSGYNAGFNQQSTGSYSTATPGQNVTYTWYTGNVSFNANGSINAVPIEFGSANLVASDPIEQQPRGLVGSLIIEPPGSVWCNVVTSGTRTCSSAIGSATVGNVYDTTVDVFRSGGGSQAAYREFVAMVQDNVYLSTSGATVTQSRSVNFGTEPMAVRYAGNTAALNDYNDSDAIYQSFSNYMLNQSTNAQQGDPKTPIFTATAGTPVRFRMLHPDGLGGFPDNVLTLHGHVWQEEPYLADGSGNPSAILGTNPLSQWMGARDGFGPGNKFDILLSSAGGRNGVPGDYLYESFPAQQVTGGSWGLFRVAASTGYAAPMVLKAVKPLPKPAALQPSTLAHIPGARFLTEQEVQKIETEQKKELPPQGKENVNSNDPKKDQ